MHLKEREREISQYKNARNQKFKQIFTQSDFFQIDEHVAFYESHNSIKKNVMQQVNLCTAEIGSSFLERWEILMHV